MNMFSDSHKLNTFYKLACNGFKVGTQVIPDPTEKDTQKKARKWLEEELGFINQQEKFDLILMWERAIADGREVYWFYKHVMELSNKYEKNRKLYR